MIDFLNKIYHFLLKKVDFFDTIVYVKIGKDREVKNQDFYEKLKVKEVLL